MNLLYGLAASMNSAANIDALFDAALTALQQALGAERSSILVSDAEGVMRFRAWRGLSEQYRRAVDGHSPWPRDAVNPEAILVADVASNPAMAPYVETFRAEGIAALG